MADIDSNRGHVRIDLAKEPDFELGALKVCPAERAVVADGARRELQPRVMQVLVALAKAHPAVVSRDRLLEQCWDGRIVGDDALNRCVLALRHLAQEISPQPFSIETVPRIGHRLVIAGERSEHGKRSPTSYLRWVVAVVLAALLAGAGYLIWKQQSDASSEPAAIAVLPFRNLGPGDPYFAQGIGEEILGQLSREPHFRVIGSSSASQFGDNPDVNEVASRLGVDYILEGSVRRQGDQVRVNAGLVRASDETRLWSGSYDGKLDDIFAIQQRVGAAIAAALQRKLVRAPALSGPLVTRGEAYNLYLTARALIRTNNRRVGPTAVDLLRDAIRIDPGYAPAWASLADATIMQGALGNREEFIPAVRVARGYAQHAVDLAPDLAEAHRSLGRTFDHGDPRGVFHLRRASQLNPGDAENLLDFSWALSATGEFDRASAAIRQAHQIDPLWYRTAGQMALALAERGDRKGAEALGRRELPDKGANLHILLGRIAWIFADYSEAVRHWSIVIKSNSPRWGHTAQRTVYDAMHAAGVKTADLVDVPEPLAGRSNWRAWIDSAPDPAVWRQRNQNELAAAVYRKQNLMAAKHMLNAGREAELVATYDSPVGLFGLQRKNRIRVDQLNEAPVIVLALRGAGRDAEADRMLAEAETVLRAVYKRGAVPTWFDADAAALYAAGGKTGEALASLERAFSRGWRQNGGADLRDIGDEPAFRSLHNEPRFQRLRGKIAAHYARERKEILELL